MVNEQLPIDVGVQNDPEANETGSGEQSTTEGVVMAQGELVIAQDRENIQPVHLDNEYLRQQYEQIISYAREAAEAARAAAAASKDALESMNQIVPKVEKQHKGIRSIFTSLEIPFLFLEYGISAYQMIAILFIGISLSWIITKIDLFQRI